MASRKEEESEEFKVVDRRAFTSEGERRGDAPPEAPPEPAESKPPAAAAAPPPALTPPQAALPHTPQIPHSADAASAASSAKSATAPPPPAAAPQDAPAQQGAAQFDHLIMSLVTSAMYQLGMAARPGEMPPPPDLPAAQETIDILGLLQQKTAGNLTPEEDELLTGSLQELRLAFVEMRRSTGRIR